MSSRALQGQVAVITGASRGIGRAVAEQIAASGGEVFLAARTAQDLVVVQKSIESLGGLSHAVPCDVSDSKQVESLFSLAEERGPVKILVCAAGILVKSDLINLPDKVWHQILGINLTGSFFCCRRAMRSMKDSGGGRIINFSSLSGLYGTEKFPGLSAYNVSKYGVVGLTEAIAVEGRDIGISAICISPGAVDTEMSRAANPDLKPGLKPIDVGRLVVSLLNPDTAPASGANIPLFSNR